MRMRPGQDLRASPEPEPDATPCHTTDTGLWVRPWGPTHGLLAIGLMLVGLYLILDLAALAGVDLEAASTRYPLLLLQFGAFLAIPLVILRARGGRLSDLGLRRVSAPVVLGAALRAPAMVLLVVLYHELLRRLGHGLVAALEEEVRQQADAFAAPLPAVLVLSVLVGPLAEEVLFRGFLYGGLRTGLGKVPAAIVSALLFAAIHQMPVAAPGLMALGIWLALLYERHRSLAVPVALHASFNMLVLIVQWLSP